MAACALIVVIYDRNMRSSTRRVVELTREKEELGRASRERLASFVEQTQEGVVDVDEAPIGQPRDADRDVAGLEHRADQVMRWHAPARRRDLLLKTAESYHIHGSELP